MDSGTMALLLVGAMAVLLAAWMWACWAWVQDSRGTHKHINARLGMHTDCLQFVERRLRELRPVEKRMDELERRIAGVEALLVSTVGQETEDFCRAMDELMERMEKPEEKQEPAPKPKTAPKEKLTLSKEHCGRYKKKGAGRG